MQYVIIALFMALVFGLCFGVDRLCRKLFPRDERKVVRLPRRSAVFGILLSFFGFAAMLFFWRQLEWYFRVGAALVLLLGVFLLVQYFSFSIRYDAEGFVYRGFFKKPVASTYGEISGQRSLLTRSGVNSTLYTKHGEVPIFSALQGVQDFLKTAFSVWCEKNGIEPDTVENNPAYFTYFPEPK